MNSKKTGRAAVLPLLLGLLLPCCPPARVVQSPDATPQWVAFSYLGGDEAFAGPFAAQPAMAEQVMATELRTTMGGVQTTVLLGEGMAHVHQGGREVWRSDPSWDVRDALTADLDGDGRQELAFVVWKPFIVQPSLLYDEFGFPSPWEEGSLRNHLFLYRWRAGEWRPGWCSSPIADPIREIGAGDVDGDGSNELVVLETSYEDAPDEPARYVSVWRWNGWGFTLRWRSTPGRYGSLALQDVTGDQWPDMVLRASMY